MTMVHHHHLDSLVGSRMAKGHRHSICHPHSDKRRVESLIHGARWVVNSVPPPMTNECQHEETCLQEQVPMSQIQDITRHRIHRKVRRDPTMDGLQLASAPILHLGARRTGLLTRKPPKNSKCLTVISRLLINGV